MLIDFALGTYLTSRTNVTAVVGSSGVVADKGDQKKSPPFIVYSITGGDSFQHAGGSSDLAEAIFQITCRAKTYVKARELYEILRDELDGYSGTWGTVSIRRSVLSEPANASEPDGGGSDTSNHAMRGTLQVHYFRDVPTFGE